MSRKKFIESIGGTCRNWSWSWSFVSHAKRIIFFGVWDTEIIANKQLLMKETWSENALGRKTNGYKQSLEHLRLVEEEKYQLYTFIQYHKLGNSLTGSAKLKGFSKNIQPKLMVKKGGSWYAVDH